MMREHGPGAMVRMAADRKKPSRPTRILLKAFFSFLKGFTGVIILTSIISIIYSATQIINPIILANGVDDIVVGTINIQTILILSLMFSALALVGFLLESLSTRILSKIGASMVNKIRLTVYHKLIHSSMAYIKSEQSGNVTARITSDTSEVATGIHVFISIVIQFLLIIATFIVLILKTGWQITLICISSIPISLLASTILSNAGRRIIVKIRRAFGVVSGKMAESLAGIAVGKAFNREEGLAAQLKILNQQHYNMNKQFGLMMNVMMPLISMVSSIALALILYVGGYLHITINMSVGDIFLGTALAERFLRPLIMLSMSFPQLQSSLGAMDRIIDVLEATPAITDNPEAQPLETNYSISFDRVWFAYNEKNWVIKDVTFSINEGELVAFVGHTGAGKTTIASMLLPRFYDIQKGEIKIGNQNLKMITQHSLRKSIGLIPQEPYLFAATVFENIRYGKPDATNDEIYEICHLIGADTFIEALPEEYNTIIQEGGKQLSAGQRQMITIARAMLADPKILILDEATSRLDAYSESLVQAAQQKLFKNRTTIVIAHRLSTIHNAERIVVFDHGRLIEFGTHKELMKLNGTFADLYNTYYAFQGLEKINFDSIIDDEEEVELSPLAMLEKNQLDPEKINKLKAEGKITPEMMAKMKQTHDQNAKSRPKKE